MSKSLNGSGSLNLTLNELRLLEIKATKVTGTDVVSLSNLTGNNATFAGTVNIGNMNISGTFEVQNMTVKGNITGNLTGEVTIETTSPANTGAFRVPFIDGVNDGVTSTGNGLMSSSNKLRFDESTGTLIISNFVTLYCMTIYTFNIYSNIIKKVHLVLYYLNIQ